jgi:hypothetical protein
MPVIILFRLARPAARRAAPGKLIVLIAWDSLDLPLAGLPRAKGSPGPVPRVRSSSPVRNRPKMNGSWSSGMPLPASATTIRAGIPG